MMIIKQKLNDEISGVIKYLKISHGRYCFELSRLLGSLQVFGNNHR